MHLMICKYLSRYEAARRRLVAPALLAFHSIAGATSLLLDKRKSIMRIAAVEQHALVFTNNVGV